MGRIAVRSLRQTYILRVWNGAPPHSASHQAVYGAEVEGPYRAPLDAPSGAVAGGSEQSSAADAGEFEGDIVQGKGRASAESGGEGETAAPKSAERFYCSLQTVASEEMHYFATLEEMMGFLRKNALAFRFKQK